MVMLKIAASETYKSYLNEKHDLTISTRIKGVSKATTEAMSARVVRLSTKTLRCLFNMKLSAAMSNENTNTGKVFLLN